MYCFSSGLIALGKTTNAEFDIEYVVSLIDGEKEIEVDALVGEHHAEGQQDAQQELSQQQQEKLTPIQTKVAKAIENVGNNGKYSIIVMKGSMPFISSTLVTDVTSECKTEVLKLK